MRVDIRLGVWKGSEMKKIKDLLRGMRRLRTAFYWLQFMGYKLAIPAVVNKDQAQKLRAMENSAETDECFIIGNGPSLRVEDLERLSGRVTFASNGIYRIFNQTDWRPTYYFVQDSIAVENVFRSYCHIIEEIKNLFVSMNFYKNYPASIKENDKLRVLYVRFCPPKNNEYRFSRDLSKKVYEGLTVTYSMIQAAVYMGFKKIYLVGIDHSYAVEVDKDGNVLRTDDKQANHFYSKEGVPEQGHVTKIVEITNAYSSARKYADSNGIQILNATRGGRLEVYEREDLDRLL